MGQYCYLMAQHQRQFKSCMTKLYADAVLHMDSGNEKGPLTVTFDSETFGFSYIVPVDSRSTRVTEVKPNSTAERAGVRLGHYILKIQGEDVESGDDVDDML